MPVDLENQKLRDIKSFYNKLEHTKLYGSRIIFNTSEYRLVNMSGRKLLAFLELKMLNPSKAIINLGFDIAYVKQLSSSPIKLNNFFYNVFNEFLSQVRNEPSLSNIKILYMSTHNNLLNILSQYISNFNFTIVPNKTEVLSNKLSTDGIHSNYKLILRK